MPPTQPLFDVLAPPQVGGEAVDVGAAMVAPQGDLGVFAAGLAAIVRMSTPTLARIETGVANPTLDTLTALFRPFGLRMGIVPLQRMSMHPSGIELSDPDFATYSESVRAAIPRNQRG